MKHTSEQVKGVFYALGAFTSWGVLALYWKALKSVPPYEILAHRILWSFVFAFVLLGFRSGYTGFKNSLRNRETLKRVTLTGVLVSTNWFLFIWAIVSDHLTDASLGYYINPLFNVLLGMFFFQEKLNRYQWFAVILAGIGVLNLTWHLGVFPWVALALASTMGFYGVIKKQAKVETLTALTLESLIVSPLALAYLFFLSSQHNLAYLHVNWKLDVLLVGAGVITAIPLIWFSEATLRLRLTTIGFFQYIGPTINLIFAVFLFGEPFTSHHAFTFGCIWIALAIFSWDSVRRYPKASHR